MYRDIEQSREVALPASVLRPVVESILTSMTEAARPYEALSLSVDLSHVEAPVDATVSVPIRVKGRVNESDARQRFDLSIEAEKHKELFPRFYGSVSVNPLGPSKAEISLQGTYEPPLGIAGTQIDATFLRGAAQSSLTAFLERLADDAASKAQAHEMEIARAHFQES